MVSETVLKSMNAIEKFSGFSAATLLRWKREFPGMPMNKIGGVYMADPVRLGRFLKDLSAGETADYSEAPRPSLDDDLQNAQEER